MPAQNKFDQSFNDYMSSTEKTRRMLAVQTEALRRIAVSELSRDGGIVMKGIAEQALLESVQISNQEVANA